MHTPPKYTTLAAWPLAICQALEAKGFDPEPLLEAAQLKRSDFLDQPDGRVDVNLMTRFWQAVEETTQDPAFALTVSNYVQPMHFRALGMLMLTTENLESALLKLGQYSELISNSVTTRTESTDTLIGLCIDPIPAITIHSMSVDSFFATLLTFSKQLGATSSPIDHVQLIRGAPGRPQPWLQKFDAPIHFDAPQNCLWFKREALQNSGVMGDEKLAAFNEGVVQEYIGNLNGQSLSAKVKTFIINALDEGEPSIQTIADQLHMSERSLRRHLKDESTSFRHMLNETRMELAQHYLKHSQLTITQISMRLAFTDTSNFSRAFSRQFNCSPSQFREQA